MPVTRPRCFTNQRCATVAANTRAIDPVPSPISTPQVRTSCQLARTKMLSPEPSAISTSALLVTRRRPNRSISAAAKGAVSPKSTRFTPTASDRVPRDQPNSSWRGTISTPGAARKPAAPSRATKATPATSQAGWMRERGGATVVMRHLPGATAGETDATALDFSQASQIPPCVVEKETAVPLRSDWSQATCPIARSLDVVGDPWVVLVLREAFTGTTRFEQLRSALGCADNVLSRRLSAMVQAGLLVRAPYDAGNRTREEYLLTDAGRELLPVLHALAQWGERHRPASTGRLVRRPRRLWRADRQRRHVHGVRGAADVGHGLVAPSA